MTGRLQFAAAAVCAAVAVIAAGCGGKAKTGVSGESGASLVTSGALAYVSIDSDFGSSQWRKLDSLLKKFPIRDRLLAELKRGLSEQKIDYDRDIKPALGPEVDIVVTAGGSPNNISYAALTKPDSIEKAKAFVHKLDERSPPPSATRVVHGWLFVADKQEMIDSVLKGTGSSLADDSKFKEALGKLPDDALVKAYANGRQLSDLVNAFFGAGAQTTAAGGSSQFGLDKLDWLAGSVFAKDDGLGFEGDIKSTNGRPLIGTNYKSKLISGVPADALAFVSFHGKRGFNPFAQAARQNPQFFQGLRRLEKELGMRLDRIFALFDHETAFYVRRGPGLPEFSLVLDEPNTAQALATIDRLANRVAFYSHARLGSEQEGGLAVKTLSFGRVTVRWAGFDGRVLLTTAPTGISDYRAGGDKLGSDSTFKDALKTAGAPDENAGLLYVNLADAVQLLQSYAGLANGRLPAEIRENLKPLRSFVAYSSSNGDVTKIAAFLALK